MNELLVSENQIGLTAIGGIESTITYLLENIPLGNQAMMLNRF